MTGWLTDVSLTVGLAWRLASVGVVALVVVWWVQRVFWRRLRARARGDSLGRGRGVHLRRDRLDGNLPELADVDEGLHFGKKVPRSVVMAAVSPVDGVTVLHGDQGSGKTMLLVRVGRTWQIAGALLVSNRWISGGAGCEHWSSVKQRAVAVAAGRPFGQVLYELLDDLRARRVTVIVGGRQSSVGRTACWDDLIEVCEVQEVQSDWAKRWWIVAIIDEAGVEADNRDWFNFPSAVVHIVNQVRKYRLAAYLACVKHEKLDGKLQDVMGWRWQCTMRIGMWRKGTFVALCYPPEDESKEAERPRRRIVWRLREGDIAAVDTGAIHEGLSAKVAGPPSNRRRQSSYRAEVGVEDA